MSRFWWVNQGQTLRQETDGGYLWSPKIERSGARSRFYDNMRLASPGDLVVSYAEGLIQFVGRVIDFAVTAPKPDEFGSRGSNWSSVGWYLPVAWVSLPSPVRPGALLSQIAHLLPGKYSPIHPGSGRGNQKAYLAEISEILFGALLEGENESRVFEIKRLNPDRDSHLERMCRSIEENIGADETLSRTEKTALVAARRGQGVFRSRVAYIESVCRVTLVARLNFLVASHIKPWRLCTTAFERLDGNNGLMLAPDVDMLFDRGFLSFGDQGDVLVSPNISASEMKALGVPSTKNVGSFSRQQSLYLHYHRANVFIP